MVEMTTVQVSIDNIPEFDNKRMLELEKETIGFYISGHHSMPLGLKLMR